tara:strand:- start:441 stop:1019 length:579 start_codon:yes stop_codon:yes gene_type:complete
MKVKKNSRQQSVGNIFISSDCKRSQSQIVTAVLLILIVIALAVIILNFSTTFVKDKLSGTGCFEVVQKEGVKFRSSTKYTCYDAKTTATDDDVLNLQVHVGDINEILAGLLIELGGADTSSIEIREGEDEEIGGVTMYDGSSEMKIPGRNEDRTYVFARTSEPETVKLYAILTDGQVCESSDSLDRIPVCRG